MRALSRFNFLDHIDKLEPTNRRNRYICPVCGGNDLTVSDEGAYSCWHGCAHSDIREAILLESRNGIGYADRGLKEDRRPVHVSRRNDLRLAVHPFRGLKPEALHHYGIEFEKIDNYNYDVYFPYYLAGGKFADYKVRPIRSKDIYWEGRRDEDGRRITNAKFVGFFGEQLCTRKSLLITEGEFDAVAAHILTEGKVSCVSVPHGAKSAPKYIKSRLEWVEKFDKVFICFDMDQDGQEAADEVMELIKPGKAFRMVLSNGRKDANQYLQEAYDPATKQYYPKRFDQVKREFQESWWAAQPRYAEFVYHEMDMIRDRMYGNNIQSFGEASGFPELDKLTGGLRKGEITTVFADPAAGKSSFSRHVAAHRLREGDRVMLVSLEEAPLETLMQLWCHYFKKDTEPKSEGVPSLEPEEIAIAKRMIREFQLVCTNLSFSQSAETIGEVLEYGVRMHDVDLIVFDNVTAGAAGSDNQHHLIEKYYAICQDIAKTYGVHVLVVSHTKRRENSKRPPTLSDGYGSGAIERFSNTVVTLHDSVARVIKNRRSGECGEFRLYWNPTKRCYVQKPEPMGFGNTQQQTNNAKKKDSPYPGRGLRQSPGGGGSISVTNEVEENTEQAEAPSSDRDVGGDIQPGLHDSGGQEDDIYRGERRENRLNLVEDPKSPCGATARLYWKPEVTGTFPQPYITPPDFSNLWEISRQIRDRLGNNTNGHNSQSGRGETKADTG